MFDHEGPASLAAQPEQLIANPADEDVLARLVLKLGREVRACVEMMNGADWVRDRLNAGWRVEVA